MYVNHKKEKNALLLWMDIEKLELPLKNHHYSIFEVSSKRQILEKISFLRNRQKLQHSA